MTTGVSGRLPHPRPAGAGNSESSDRDQSSKAHSRYVELGAIREQQHGHRGDHGDRERPG